MGSTEFGWDSRNSSFVAEFHRLMQFGVLFGDPGPSWAGRGAALASPEPWFSIGFIKVFQGLGLCGDGVEFG